MEKNLMTRTMIPVHNTNCANSCNKCYLGYRNNTGITNTDQLIAVSSMFDNVAIGLNTHGNGIELEIVSERIRTGKAYQVTLCGNITMSNDIVKAIKHAQLVGVSFGSNQPFTKDVEDVINIPISNRIRYTVLAVMDDDINESILSDAHDILNRCNFTCVYLGCRKDDMIDHDIIKYVTRFDITHKKIEDSNICTLLSDSCMECLSSNATPCVGIHSKLGWVELTSSGEIRFCPYMSKPSLSIDPNNMVEYFKTVSDDILPTHRLCDRSLDNEN